MAQERGATRRKRAAPNARNRSGGNLSGPWEYVNADGERLYRVVKRPGKRFHQESWDGSHWVNGLDGAPRVLYRLPDVLAATRAGRALFIAEGEKDVEALVAAGVTATCNPGGAGKWRPEYTEALRGAKEVRIVWDNDPRDEKTGRYPGQEHALAVGRSLRDAGIRVKFLSALEGNDLTDHLEAGHDLSELAPGPPRLPEAPSPSDGRSGAQGTVFDEAVERLREHAARLGRDLPRKHYGDNGYEAVCPAHDDHKQSLGIKPGDKRPVLVYCQAGCEFEEIATALDMDPRDFSTSEDDEAEILEHMRRRRIRDEADRRYRAELAVAQFELPPVGRTLADDLRDPPPPTRYRIAELHPADTNSLFIAAYTTGKTTAVLNLLKSLADGVPFLGKYEVDFPEGRIGYLNYEMALSQMHVWLDDADIQHKDRIVKLDLRGQRMPLNGEGVMDRLVAWLQGNDVRFLIIDTLAKANVGFVTDENDNMQARDFTDALDELKARAGISDLLLTTHMGRARGPDGSETSRGATRYQDWADASWFLNKDSAGTRTLWADGRDVEIRHDEAIVLGWDERTRRVFATGQTKREATASDAAHATVAKLEELGDGIDSTTLRNGLSTEGHREQGIAACEQLGWIERRQEGRAKRCYITEAGRDRRVRVAGEHSGAEQ